MKLKSERKMKIQKSFNCVGTGNRKLYKTFVILKKCLEPVKKWLQYACTSNAYNIPIPSLLCNIISYNRKVHWTCTGLSTNDETLETNARNLFCLFSNIHRLKFFFYILLKIILVQKSKLYFQIVMYIYIKSFWSSLKSHSLLVNSV